MTRRVLRSTPFAALCAAVLVAACSKGDGNADSAKVADSVAAANATAAPPAPAAPTLSDANIVALLDGVHMTDSSTASIAATKGTSAEVKTFARNMMRDHHALRKSGQALATKLNVTAELPAGDNSQAAATAWKDSLNAMPKGAAWDQAYIGHEVTYHEAALATAQAGLAAAQNAELKALIEKAAPNVQAHIEHAKSIQAKLGGGTGAMGGMNHDSMTKKTP